METDCDVACRYFIYRLFDPIYSHITRYVGCTLHPKSRLAFHRSGSGSALLMKAWARWLRDHGNAMSMSVVSELTCSRKEADHAEFLAIQSHADNNPFLLNSHEWKRDKIESGIDRHVVKAYLALLGSTVHADINDFHNNMAAMHLERAFPRLQLFHYRAVFL